MNDLNSKQHPVSIINLGNVFAFGNVVISNGEAPNCVAPRLDWSDCSKIIEGGEPNLFSALQWRYNLAPTLQGRDQELRSVLKWAESGDSNIQIRLLTGTGGSGKTRLAATAARELKTSGWTAGFLPHCADETQVIIGPKGEAFRKLFLIIDYPEERMTLIEHLIQALRDIDDSLVEFPIRILLVSRRDLEGWRQVMTDMGHRAGRQELAALGALSVEQAYALFTETADNFTQLLDLPIPDLDGTR